MSLALLNRAVQYDEIYCFKLYAIVCFMVLTNTLFTAIFVHRGTETPSMASEEEAETTGSKHKDQSKQIKDLIPVARTWL